MEVELEFSQDASAVAEIRDLVCRVAAVEVSHPAVLVASELATNAIQHSTGPFKIMVHASPVIRVEVTDHSPELLPTRRAFPSWKGGYGLPIVTELSDQWGMEIDDDSKVVWAEIRDGSPDEGQ